MAAHIIIHAAAEQHYRAVEPDYRHHGAQSAEELELASNIVGRGGHHRCLPAELGAHQVCQRHDAI